jgi:hypothetical protein
MKNKTLMKIKMIGMSKDKMILRGTGIILILAFLIAGRLYNPFESHFLSCQFKGLTGYDCPTCGLSRSIYSFLSFRFLDSIRYNLFGCILISGLFVFLAKFSAEIIIKKEIVIPATKSLQISMMIFLLFLVFLTWILRLFSGS